MAVNQSSQFQADIVAYIDEETLPLARRQLVAYQFGDPLTLPEGRGTTYTATRYLRVPLPANPLSEGVPPVGEQMSLQQVSATANQWGDKITITDVAEMTIFHPLFQKGMELMGLQIAETLERNTYNNLNGGTQVNYVNTRGSRGALLTTDVLNTHEINRMVGALKTIGAPRYMGDEQTDEKIDAEDGGSQASKNPRAHRHYVALIHPLPVEDLRENQSIVNAWSYSDVNRLYNDELGEWGGIRFCESNMIPSWTGYAAPAATNGGGNTGTIPSGIYKVIVTGQDTQNQYESYVSQTQTGLSISANGSLLITTPNVAGFTFNVYLGTGTTPANLGLSASGPTQGPMQGQATQLPPNTAVVITGIGVAQTPPAAPATGNTVYPTYVIGRGAYGQVVLSDVEWTALLQADKSDPLNQLRVMGWKCFYGTLIENNQFFGRIESASAFSATFG